MMIPEINGLVLAGGKSVRMGRDKSAMQWHGEEQLYYMAGLLKPLCKDVFISRRQGQDAVATNVYKVLVDSYTGMGPYGAILSAFKFQPHVAWLVVACDLPLLRKETLASLIKNRDPKKIATTFKSPHDGLPEPLITIWEPASYELLLSLLADGINCPRKAIIRSCNAHIIEPPATDDLLNVNTQVDFEKARQILSNRALQEH